jgi:K(+)-stimulated pyrophosphate-energized sodium pump
VASTPLTKFTTLFGLLAVELAVELSKSHPQLTAALAAGFYAVSAYFVYRSFYNMRIETAATK